MAVQRELVLKAEAGGITREFPKSKLKLVDKKKPPIRLHFLRYAAFRKRTKLIRVEAPDEIDEMAFIPREQSFDIPDVFVTAKNKAFRLADFEIDLASFFRGYIYIFDANDPDLWYEYEIGDEGELHAIVWKESNPKGRRKPNGPVSKYFQVKYEKTVFVCYSPVQWSVPFHKKMRTEASKKKYMTEVVCTGYNRDGSSDHVESLNYNQIYCKFYEEQKDHAKDYSNMLASISKHERDPKTIENCDYQVDMFVGLRDAVSIADEVAYHLKDEIVMLRSIVEAMQTGVNEQKIYNRMKKGLHKSGGLTKDQKQIQEMLTLAKMAYTMVYNSDKGIKEYGGGKIGWYGGLYKPKLEQVLAVEKRKTQRNKINKLRDDLGGFIFSDYYHDAYDIHKEGSPNNVIEGKHQIMDHLAVLAIDPRKFDQEFDLKSVSKSEDSWKHKIAGTLGKSSDSSLMIVLNKEAGLTSKLIEDWPGLTVKFADTISRMLECYSDKAMRDMERVTVTKISTKLYGRYKLMLDRMNTITFNGKKVFSVIEATAKVEMTGVITDIEKSVTINSGKTQVTKSRITKWKGTGAPAIVVDTTLFDKPFKVKTNDVYIKTQDVVQNPNYSKGAKAQKVMNSGSFKGTVAMLQIFNISIAIQKLSNDPSSKNWVNVGGISAELTTAILEFTKVSMSKALPKFAERLMFRANIVGGVITVVMCFWEANDRSKLRDTDAALAWMGAGMAFTAATAATLGLAIAAGPVGWIAAGIGLGFIILANYLTDTPLQTFFKLIPFSDNVDFSGNINGSVGILNLEFYKSRKFMMGRNNAHMEWMDFKVANAHFFDIIVGGNITSEPLKLINKDVGETEIVDIHPKLELRMEQITTGLISKLLVGVSFRQFFEKSDQLKYDVFFYKEGLKHGAPIKLNVKRKVRFTARTKNAPAHAKVTIDIDETITRDSVVVFICRLDIGNGKFYPTTLGSDRYLGIYSRLFYIKSTVTSMNNSISTFEPRRASNVKVGSFNKLKFGEWK